MKSILRVILPEVLMVAIMAVLSLAFMSPVFEGKTLYQNDILQAKNMAKEIDQFQKQTGEYSAWTNSAFAGMPAYQIKSPPSGNVFQWIFRILKLYLPGYTVAILFVCMLGFYFLLRTLNLQRWLALAGAVAFGFGAHHLQLIEAGHVSKVYAIAYMAPVIAGLLLVFKRKYLIGGLMTAVGLGIQLVTNHVQVSYYLGIIILVYFLVELVFAIREKYFDHLVKSGLILAAALVIAILPNFTSLLTTMEYSKESTRGKSELKKEGVTETKGLDIDYITNWSYGVGETLNLYIPNLYGGGASELKENASSFKALSAQGITDQQTRDYVNSRVYWGGQPFTSGPHYVGSVVIFLAILGLFMVKGPRKWWLLVVIILSVMLAWGRNFMGLTEFFVKHVPLYAKFRDVTSTLVMAQVALPFLAFLGLSEWFGTGQDANVKVKKLYIAGGIAAGIALLLALAPGIIGSFTSAGDASLPEWLRGPLRDDRMALARRDAVRTLLFVLVAAGILWYSLRAKVKKEYLFIALGVLILADLWTVDKRYLKNSDFTSKRSITEAMKAWPADETILKDKDQSYRVFDLTADPFRSGRTSGFHKSVGGYHGAKMGRYQDLIDAYLANNITAIRTILQKEPSIEKINSALAEMNVLNMLNARYLIMSPQAPLQNPYASGNAWFTDRIKWVANANEELDALKTSQITTEAIIDQRFKSMITDLPTGLSPNPEPDQIRLAECKPNYLKYESQVVQNRLAIFSEIYYSHGWKSFIDGREVPHVRADYALRAMVVPAGKHVIEFRFAPKSLQTGQAVSWAGSILVLLMAAGLLYMELRRRKKLGIGD